MELQEVLVWLLQGGGAGVVTYWLMENLPFLVNLTSENKRYASLVLTAALSIGAFLIAVALRYEAQPETLKAWLEAVFRVVAMALNLSLVIHGYKQLKKPKGTPHPVQE